MALNLGSGEALRRSRVPFVSNKKLSNKKLSRKKKEPWRLLLSLKPSFDSFLVALLAGFKEARSTHTTTNAHTDNAVLLFSALEFSNDVPCEA